MAYLIVPMLVEAYASGRVRPQQRDVPVLAPDYSRVLANSVLGSRNTPEANARTSPLEAGIHLHFILPDSFTHSQDGEDYPAVPDRYLVTRLWREPEGQQLQARCFVVESNFISNESSYQESVTIPFFTDGNERRRWRYLGRSYPAGCPPETGDGAYLPKLTAVGPGDHLFAAYYPSCRSVFGFYDDLADLPPERAAELSYFVAGYFAGSENDPLAGVETPADFQAALAGLNWSVAEPEAACRQTVLYGAIENIDWQGLDHDYANIPSGKIDLVCGCNTVEALSRTIQNNLGPEEQPGERMLSVLQYELYDQLEQTDGNFLLDDNIHYNQFSRSDSLEERPYFAFDQQNSPPVDGGLGQRFSDLKRQGETLGENRRLLHFQRDKLFTLWEQYVLAYEEGEPPAGCPSRDEMLAELKGILQTIDELQAQIRQQEAGYKQRFAGFAGQLPAGAKCQENGNEFFFGPKDPVLLLSGQGLNRSFAFGEDGRFTSDGTLACQTEPVQGEIPGESLLKQCFGDLPFQGDLPAFYPDLLVQTCLVCEKLLGAVQSLLGEIKIKGELSSQLALNKNPFDFTTLFMLWGVDYYPLASESQGEDTLKDWEFVYGDCNLVYKGAKRPEEITPRHITGQMLLTPHGVKTLSGVMERWSDIYSENEEKRQEMQKLAEKVKNLPVVSQSLSGFTDYFSGFQQSLQFPVMGIGDDSEIAGAVSSNINESRRSILPFSDLLPVRGGYFKISDLALVSSFGLMQQLAESSWYNDCQVDFAETLNCGLENYGLLPPVFSDLCRLQADFVAADNQEVFSSPTPETSPVCGIIVPELLNRRLLVYNASGAYLGMLKTVYRQGAAGVRWLSRPGADNDFDKLDFGNADFKAFLRGLLKQENAFAEFNRLLDVFLDSKQSSGQLLWGRPLVLARLRVKHIFYGEPQFGKSLAEWGKYDSRGVAKVAFRLGVGDMERMSDGVLGCFNGDDYAQLYPAFGAENPGTGESYVKYKGQLNLANSDGARYFSVLLAPDLPLTLQTGLLPNQTLRLEQAHIKVTEKLALWAEISPLLSDYQTAALPVLTAGGENRLYKWYSVEGESFVEHKTAPPLVSLEETVLMDGFIIQDHTGEKK